MSSQDERKLIFVNTGAGERRWEQLLPVCDVVNEMLLEQQTPPFNHIQQRRLERPRVDFHPAMEDADGLDATHLLTDLLIGVDLLPELLEAGGCLGDPILCMSLDFRSGEDVPIEQELAEEFLSVIPIEVRVAIEAAAIFTTGRHHGLHATHQVVAHISQVSHVLHVSLGEGSRAQ